MIVVFYRGFFCPQDRQQLPQLVQFQNELAVNYGKLVTVGVDPPIVQAAFRAGLDVIVNTNYMTQTQDFSTIPYIGKDLNNEEIINRFFEKGHV